MIAELANVLYTPETLKAAQEYLLTRGINMSAMRFPPAYTGSSPEPFKYLSKFLPPHLFTETLFFPITDVENPSKLIGFDARYLGTDKTRLRYRKFKDNENEFLLYYTKPVNEINADTPLIVAEGVIDAETIAPLGYPVISPLTAMHHFKFCCFLKAISNNIYFAYDNDSSGQNAVKSIIKEIQVLPELERVFKFLNFQGKDLNDSMKTKGKDYLFSILKSQIF